MRQNVPKELIRRAEVITLSKCICVREFTYRLASVHIQCRTMRQKCTQKRTRRAEIITLGKCVCMREITYRLVSVQYTVSYDAPKQIQQNEPDGLSR